MSKRKWNERSSYPMWKWSFDFFWRINKDIHYLKPWDLWVQTLGFDAQCLYKWIYYGIEYKASSNINKFTFSAFSDLEKECKKLQHIINCWWKAFVIIIFNKVTKFYPLSFVLEYWDKQLTIEDHGVVIPKIKDNTNRTIYDISILFK